MTIIGIVNVSRLAERATSNGNAALILVSVYIYDVIC